VTLSPTVLSVWLASAAESEVGAGTFRGPVKPVLDKCCCIPVLQMHAKMPGKPGGWPNPRHEKDGGIADY